VRHVLGRGPPASADVARAAGAALQPAPVQPRRQQQPQPRRAPAPPSCPRSAATPAEQQRASAA
jgi:hypothetical protein